MEKPKNTDELQKYVGENCRIKGTETTLPDTVFLIQEIRETAKTVFIEAFYVDENQNGSCNKIEIPYSDKVLISVDPE